MKHNRIGLYIDLLFCLVIMPLIIMLLPVDRWLVTNTAFLATLVAYVYLLYFAYRRANIPQMFMQGKYVKIGILMALLIGATVMLTYFPAPESTIDDPKRQEARMNIRTQTIWFFFLMVTGFTLAIELTFELFKQMLSKQEIEAEKNKAELALYKAQIDPHFLFNTLNTLYALVVTGSEKTEPAFVLFSDILRYMYSGTVKDLVTVESELKYIRQYTELQSLRLNAHTRVQLDTASDGSCGCIPPMVLITFVENAFKYGTSAENDCLISISIHAENGVLTLKTENAVMHQRTDGKTGIGIANCRKRLEMLYPGRFTMKTGREGDTFKAELKIELKQQ